VIGGEVSPNLVGNGQPAPLGVTLVHHDAAVREFVASVVGAQGWGFDAYHNLAEAVGAVGPPLPGSSDVAPANGAPAAAASHVVMAALRPPNGPCGLEWTRRLVALDGPARLVLLAESADAALGLSAMYSGASAFIVLPLNRAVLLTAIRRAASGRRFLSVAAVEPSLDALCCPEPAPSCTDLTPTEIKVLWAMAQGRGEKGASQLLPITLKTVHTHANHIYVKLGVHSLEGALDRVFGKHGCASLCLRRTTRRERDRERERREEKLTRNAARGDNPVGSRAYAFSYADFVMAGAPPSS
jgi:two-component system, NarL family, uhpT operon response regulator UhpA